jgi:hypothetical protein
MYKQQFLFLLVGLLFINTTLHAQVCFPEDKLPRHITALTSFGQRAEWSIDGKVVYFLDKPGGDVWRITLKDKKLTQLTNPENRPKGYGYYRVLCLTNGDLLLCGGYERHQLFFEVLDKRFHTLPKKIEGEALDEGPAVSRKTMKIAWTLPGQLEIYYGTIMYKNDTPMIAHKKLLVDHNHVITNEGIQYKDIIESQNWRGKKEDELIFAQYKRDTAFRCEVFGIKLANKKIINYSKAPAFYDEPEGIYPNGKYILVESDRHAPTNGTSTIDIYKLKLDGTGSNIQRLTFFADVPGYRASNPVIRNDGKLMAFQGSYAASEAGGGCGIYIFDMDAFENK